MRCSSLRIACLVLFSLPIASLCCYSADVVFVRSSEGLAAQLQRNLEIATNFYGLNLKVITLGPGKDSSTLIRAVEQDTTVGVVISANALAVVEQTQLLGVLDRRPQSSGLPLLILGVTPETDATLLKAWSGGDALACRRTTFAGSPRYVINRFEGFTRQLADFEVPLRGNDASYFVLSENSKTQQVTKIQADRAVFPVFIATTLGSSKVFLDCTVPYKGEAVAQWDMLKAFAEIAPAMMFIRYSAGDRGWHAIHHYANLTIDDPWLREPYGNLQYKNLLAEMEKHNFHSTIAFIPWNYDRSEPQVVSLIRDHPDRFSISIHGDNHDHKEFTDYRSKPLTLQVDDLRQSLARMDKFQMLTGIPYDKVMVFPHSIGPEKTLSALKNENFLATVNSSNVPMDAVRPSGLSFDMRAMTLSFGGFASIRRYSVEGQLPTSLIVANLFLDNPLLFYGHQGLFSSGTGAFDAEADYVNRLQPDTRWRSLGEIVRHLYVMKLRDDNNYDVLSFTGTISLENVFKRHTLFYVRKEESERPAMVRIDGQAWPYSLHDGYLETQIPVESGKARILSITYRNAQRSPTIGIEKRSFRVYCLRMASDFRDIALARSAPGRSLIRLYENHGRPLMLVLMCALVFAVALFILGVWRLRVMIETRRRAVVSV